MMTMVYWWFKSWAEAVEPWWLLQLRTVETSVRLRADGSVRLLVMEPSCEPMIAEVDGVVAEWLMNG